MTRTKSFLAAFLVWSRCGMFADAARTAVVGQSGVSAQMTFLQDDDHVVFLDKTEDNPLRVNGRPAWAASFNYKTKHLTPFDIVTNTFCAGGAPAGNGRMVITGGNIAVGPGGKSSAQGVNPYYAVDGGFALNIYDAQTNSFTSRKRGIQRERWYPSMEPMADGSVSIVSGASGGGYVSTEALIEPTIEFYPSKGKPVNMPIIQRTVPMNLYPLTYLMSTGKLFVQSYNEAVLWDLDRHTEDVLPNKPGAPGPYPANQAVVLLPLTPANNYKETVLFCGGLEGITKEQWGDLKGPKIPISQRANSRACQAIEPVAQRQWTSPTTTPEGRTMAIFVILPDGKIWWGGGGRTGTAGYVPPGHVGAPIHYSLADHPGLGIWTLDPTTYKWQASSAIKVPRLYHSSATLLADGSVLVAGSNPNPDRTPTTIRYGTEYTVEIWYPDWFDAPRPSRDQLPFNYQYAAGAFSIDLRQALGAAQQNTVITSATVRLIRTGFSTHAVQWGQRSIELRTTLQGEKLQVDNFPANRNLFAPGPALAFLVINGVPSQGRFVHVGPRTLPAAR